jgi:hypothetical protein
MTRLRKFLTLALLLAAGIWVGRDRLRLSFEELMERNIASRHLRYVCGKLAAGQVERKSLCDSLLDQVPALTDHFRRLKAEDGDWFQARGWSPVPEAYCVQDQLRFSYMGRLYLCEGEDFIEREAERSSFSFTLVETAFAADASDGEKSDSQKTLLPKIRDDIDRLTFGHSAVVNPVQNLPSTISFVNSSGAVVTKVRALLVLDGELIIVPLRYESEFQAFRGTFPTPAVSGTYQFQVLLSNKRSITTETFRIPLDCQNPFNSEMPLTYNRRRLLEIQKEVQQLQYIVQTLKRFGDRK